VLPGQEGDKGIMVFLTVNPYEASSNSYFFNSKHNNSVNDTEGTGAKPLKSAPSKERCSGSHGLSGLEFSTTLTCFY
jgi:hypothetical protein